MSERSRAALTAALACLAALLLTGTPLAGPMASYAQSAPLLAGLGTWLALRAAPTRQALAAGIAGLIGLAPAAGFYFTRLGIDRFEVPYVPGDAVLFRLLSTATATPRGTGPLLAASAVALLVVFRRPALPVGLGMLGGAAGAALGRLLLYRASRAWLAGDFRACGDLAFAAGLTGALALVGALVGIALGPGAVADGGRLRRAPALLVVLATLLSAWFGTPPIAALSRTLPVPVVPADVPLAPPGRAYAAPVVAVNADTTPAELSAWLDDRGLPVVDEARWPCSGLPPFQAVNLPRNVVGLAAPPAVTVGELAHLQPTLLAHGVHEIAFIARSPPQHGSYGARARWSGAGAYLDRPPAGSRMILADANGWQDLAPTPWFQPDRAVCGLLVEPALRVDALQRLLRELSGIGGEGPCQDTLFLVLKPDLPPMEGGPDAPRCAALPGVTGTG